MGTSGGGGAWVKGKKIKIILYKRNKLDRQTDRCVMQARWCNPPQPQTRTTAFPLASGWRNANYSGEGGGVVEGRKLHL